MCITSILNVIVNEHCCFATEEESGMDIMVLLKHHTLSTLVKQMG